MSLQEIGDTERLAGITDLEWWHWFNEDNNRAADPWHNWLSQVRYPHEGPLHTWLENDIENAIKAADALRLVTQPQTKTFSEQWATFRRYHEELDERGKYRRNRYMTWRAAALKVLCECDRFQDDTDAREAHDKLAQTMRWFTPNIDAVGNFHGGNFWRGNVPPTEYAAMVLLLMTLVRKGHASP